MSSRFYCGRLAGLIRQPGLVQVVRGNRMVQTNLQIALRLYTTPSELQKTTDPTPPPLTGGGEKTSTMPTATRLQIKTPPDDLSIDKEPIVECTAATEATVSAEKPKEPTKAPENAVTKATKSAQKMSTEAMRQQLGDYIWPRYGDYVKNYDKVLEKNFPSAVKIYRIFFEGLKDFYSDIKHYLKISRIVKNSPQGLKVLNRRELELYLQMPRDMVKVAPALAFSSLPFVGYAIFPLVFMYPRQLLTTHFWTPQQRAEFQQLKMKKRLEYNRAVFRCLQAKLEAIRHRELSDELESIFGLLGSGFHPDVDTILRVRPLFAEFPYCYDTLTSKHIKCLSEMHGVPKGIFTRFRLNDHGSIVLLMDQAIRREGGVHNMLPDAIYRACLIRGLNPVGLNNEDMIEWLRDWVAISTEITEDHMSLLLHLPLFLGYNHPSNWKLLHNSKKSLTDEEEEYLK